MQTQKNFLIIYSPHELVKKLSSWKKDTPFYMNALGTTHSFGVPLWAAAYEQCQHLWKNSSHGPQENFPFVLNVGNCPGFVLLGLELGIKFFLFQGTEKVFENLHTIVRKKEGNIWC